LMRELQDPLSLYILEGQIGDGAHVVVDAAADGEGLMFETAVAAGV